MVPQCSQRPLAAFSVFNVVTFNVGAVVESELAASLVKRIHSFEKDPYAIGAFVEDEFRHCEQ
jgi:hypothetical protein